MKDFIQTVFIDLDGTVLRDDKTISQANIAAVQKLMQNGIDVCVTSGRPRLMVNLYMQQLNLQTPLITNNGANIYLPETDELISQTFLDPADTMKFLEYSTCHNLNWAIFKSHAIYYLPDEGRTRRYLEYTEKCMAHGLRGVQATHIHTLDEAKAILEQGAERLSMIIRSEQEANLILDYFKTNHKIRAIRSTPETFDVVDSRVDKWNAICAVCEYNSVPLDRICVFGNDMNDYRMIKNCRHSFIVANAEAPLHPHATYVVDSNNNDGFAKAVDLYFNL